MKTVLYRMFICYALLLCAENGFSQDNKYCVKYEMQRITTREKNGGLCNSDNDIFSNVLLVCGANNRILINAVDVGMGDKNQTITHSLDEMPKIFILSGTVGSELDEEDAIVSIRDKEYTKGDVPFEFQISEWETTYGCTRHISLTYKITIDDPAIIKNVKFENNADGGTGSVCGTDTRIVVEMDRYYDGQNKAELQILDNTGVWQTIKQQVASESTTYITYDDIKQYVNIGNGIQFRTKKKFLDDSYSYNINTTKLKYLPQFKFPSGKNLIVETPVCRGEETTLRIPYSDNINYKGTLINSSNIGGNFITDTLEKDGTYYILSKYLSSGNWQLKIEYPQSGCFFTKDFTITDIPRFEIKSDSTLYLDKTDSFEIQKHGGSGGVSVYLSGSYYNNNLSVGGTTQPADRVVIITAGNSVFTGTLPSLTGGQFITFSGYTSGRVIINLPSGTYNNVYATNSSGCTSTSISLKLREPQPISYTLTVATSPRCSYDSAGSIKVSDIKGGIREKKYSIDGGAQQSYTSETITINNVLSGEHNISIQDNFGNTATKSITIPSPPSGVNINSVVLPPSLSCTEDGAIKVIASGGVRPYQYSKNGNSYQLSDTLKGFASGDQTIYVKDANGCTYDFNIKVPEGKKTVISSIRATAPTCNNSSDGKCIIVIGNRTGTLFSSGSISGTVSGDTITYSGNSGTYVTRITESSCSMDTSFTIPEKPQISIITTVTSVSDKGSATGKINVSLSGGNSGTYRVYLLDGADTLQTKNTSSICTFENIRGAYINDGKPYKIVVYDIKGCSNLKDEVRVKEPEETLKLTAELTQPISSYNGSDAIVSVSAKGGWNGYYYSIDSITWIKETIFRNLSSGTHKFFLRDVGNGTASTSIKIENPLKLDISDTVHPLCELSNASLVATALGGILPYTYRLLTVNGNTVRQMISSGRVIFDGIASGSYRVEVRDSNGCTVQSEVITFNEYKNPKVIGTDITAVRCFGESNGSIEVTATKGSRGISYFTLIKEGVDTTKNGSGVFNNLPMNVNYTVRVFDINDCPSNSASCAVTQPDSLYINIVNTVPVTFKGEQDGKIVFRATGGNAGNISVYLRDEGDKIIDSVKTSSGHDVEFTVSCGKYTVQAIDSKGCTYTSELADIIEPEASLDIIVKEVKDALCKSQTGSIVVEGVGGWGGYKYKRVTDNNYTSLNRFENLYSGTYTITVKDDRGATASKVIQVYEPDDSLRSEVISIENVSCNESGIINIAISGGTSPYNLFSDRGNDTVSVGTDDSFAQYVAVQNGGLLLHIIDNNGCKCELETEIKDTNRLVIENLRTTPVTQDTNGAIEAKIKGGSGNINYLWVETGTENIYPNSAKITNLSSGYYNLTVTDEKGCSAAESVYLHSAFDLKVEILETGNETSYEARDGYAILRTTINIKDIKLHPSDSVNTNNISIVGDTVYLSMLHGGHWLMIASDTLGRTAIAEFDIKSYVEFKFGNIDVRPVSSPNDTDGFARVEITGGAGVNNYLWLTAGDDTVSAVNDEYSTFALNLQSGIYRLFVTDTYNNTISCEIEILAPSQVLQLNIESQKNQSCNGIEDGYIILSATGGWGDYRYAYYRDISEESNLRYTNARIYSNLSAGDHYFYTVDRYGKTYKLKAVITKPDVLRADVISTENEKCKNDVDGKIFFNIYGGNNDYYFRKRGTSVWIAGNTATHLSAGSHIFEFTDSLQCICEDTLTVVITEPDSLLFERIESTHTFCDKDNGKILATLKGGTRPYFYEWRDERDSVLGRDSLITELKQSSQYRLYVRDSTGCVQYAEQFIQSSRNPRITDVEIRDVLCYGDSTGSARITSVESGVPNAPYSFIWSTGVTDSFASNLSKGQYSIIIKDTNNCQTTYYVDITEPDSLYLVIVESKNPHCFGYSDGYIKTETYGGAGNNTYLWSNNAATSNIENLIKGSYQVRVTDGNGCSFVNALTLIEPDYLSVDLGSDVVMCPNNTHVLDGGEYKSYRWYTESDSVISTDRYLGITSAGHYYLEAITYDDCSAWGDMSVSIGNSALQSDMLLPSEAEVGDTVYILEISNLPVDNIVWQYDSMAFSSVFTNDSINTYILPLRCNVAGVYTIDLHAYSGGCYSPISKEIRVFEKSADSTRMNVWSIQPIIRSAGVYPNPTAGSFTVEIKLREAVDVNLKLFDITSSMLISDRSESGQSFYEINYSNGNLRKGRYVLLVTAANKERRQIKIIVQ